jgi:leader peptidase (prepilin peptidase)/N-methyltransferase
MRMGARYCRFRVVVRSLATGGIWTKLFLGLCAVGAVYVSMISTPGAVGLLAGTFALVMLAIAIVDWRSFIIPDELNIVGLILAILVAAFQEPNAWVQAVLLAAARGVGLGIIFLALRFAYAKLRGRQGLGLGDVKLAVVGGALLDLLMIPVAIEMAALAALLVYGLGKCTGSAISPTTKMPFGVYFAPAIWLCWVIETQYLG